jgi:hypothetical protein
VIVSSSTIESFLKCPAYLYWHYIEKIQKKPEEGKKPNLATNFGTLVHKALEIYANEASLKSALDFLDEQSSRFQNGTFKNIDVAKVLVRKEVHNLEEYDLIEPEKDFSFQIGNHFWIGRFDLVAKKNNLIYIIDYKTTGDNNFQIRPNNQILSYFVGAKKVFKENEIGGIIIHLLKANTQEIQNYLIQPTFDEIEEWKDDTIFTLNNIEKCITTGIFPKIPYNCHQYNRACEYLPLCQSFGRVRASLIKTDYEKVSRRGLYEMEVKYED